MPQRSLRTVLAHNASELRTVKQNRNRGITTPRAIEEFLRHENERPVERPARSNNNYPLKSPSPQWLMVKFSKPSTWVTGRNIEAQSPRHGRTSMANDSEVTFWEDKKTMGCWSRISG